MPRAGEHLPEGLLRRVPRADVDALLVHDVAGIGLLHHPVKRHADPRLPVEDGPVDRRPAAVRGKERAVHVESAERRHAQHLHPDHVPVIDGEDEVGLHGRDLPHPLRRPHALGREDRHSLLPGGQCRGLEPDVLARVVLVRDQGDHVVAALKQQREALIANLAVSEEQYPGCCHGKSGAQDIG